MRYKGGAEQSSMSLTISAATHNVLIEMLDKSDA